MDYTLEFLSLGGIEETFLFSSVHSDEIKKHIEASVNDSANWSLTMRVKVIVSESCRSFGDCLRDLDAKGLIRGDFVLLEAGVVANIKLLPLLNKHSVIAKADKGAAMTLVYQEAGVGQNGHKYSDEVVIASNEKNRILFHKKLGHTSDRKINFPLVSAPDSWLVHIYPFFFTGHIYRKPSSFDTARFKGHSYRHMFIIGTTIVL